MNGKEWPIEDAADIMIRMVDLEINHCNNPQSTVELLEVAEQNFKGIVQLMPMLDRWQKVVQIAQPWRANIDWRDKWHTSCPPGLGCPEIPPLKADYDDVGCSFGQLPLTLS